MYTFHSRSTLGALVLMQCAAGWLALAGCSPTVRAPINAQMDLPPIQQTFEGVVPIAGDPEEIVNSIGMTLRRIPPGKYLAGWPDRENPDFDEFGGPQHEVTITRPLYMAIHEVTQAQYAQVMGNNPSRHASTATEPVFAERFRDQDTTRYPVEQVSQEEALEFCRALSALPDEVAAGRVYVLPTEAQWEHACRAGASGFFHTGDSLSSRQANFDGNFPFPLSNEIGPVLGRPTDVGSYPPNAWGLYDMHGNVQEWCLDATHAYGEFPLTDPTADGTKTPWRALRGGCFAMNANYCRAGARNRLPKTSRNYQVGFRVMIQQ